MSGADRNEVSASCTGITLHEACMNHLTTYGDTSSAEQCSSCVLAVLPNAAQQPSGTYLNCISNLQCALNLLDV